LGKPVPNKPALNKPALKKPAVKLGAIDLNLLVVFDAILRERSVTRAGHQLGLSQPAMSHALTRLRHMLKDELFVRSPNGMMPTPRAEQLAGPIRLALDALQQSLEPIQFEPSKATRTFHVAVDNYSAVVLVAPISLHIAKIAPGITLDFRPVGTSNILDLLDRSELDLAIGPFGAPGERFSLKRLLQDQFVVVFREGHPAADAQELSIEQFAALSQLEISSAQFGSEFADDLTKPRRVQRFVMRAPFLAAARILSISDMAAVLPLNIAKDMTKSHPLIFRRLQRPPKLMEATMIWARRLDNQPAHLWLRDVVSHVANDFRAAAP
jgi:DNA-binding transcriptional LysR family regulator